MGGNTRYPNPLKDWWKYALLLLLFLSVLCGAGFYIILKYYPT